MAGRGRGGGGRGRGKGMTFDARDMGFGIGEQLPAPVLQPPPTYPSLDNLPAPLQPGPEIDYVIALKKDLTVFLKDYMSFTEQRDWDSQFDWRRLPSELRRGNKRSAGSARSIKKPTFDITKLDDLAKNEEGAEEPEGDKEEVEEKEEGDQQEGEDDELEEDVDEEMDDGTDYVNNYFDNGEGYHDDDDDNANDGPIY